MSVDNQSYECSYLESEKNLLQSQARSICAKFDKEILNKDNNTSRNDIKICSTYSIDDNRGFESRDSYKSPNSKGSLDKIMACRPEVKALNLYQEKKYQNSGKKQFHRIC